MSDTLFTVCFPIDEVHAGSLHFGKLNPNESPEFRTKNIDVFLTMDRFWICWQWSFQANLLNTTCVNTVTAAAIYLFILGTVEKSYRFRDDFTAKLFTQLLHFQSISETPVFGVWNLAKIWLRIQTQHTENPWDIIDDTRHTEIHHTTGYFYAHRTAKIRALACARPTFPHSNLN